MSIKDNLNDAVKTAMRAKDKEVLKVLRGLSAAIKQYEIDNQIEANDAQILAIFNKQIKQRKDAEQQFRDGKRTDLAEIEAFEISIIQPFLPEQLVDSEIDAIVTDVISNTEASGAAAMGHIMSTLKERLQGRADMGKVSRIVKAKLG